MDLEKNRNLTLLRDICESIQYGYTASATDSPVGPRFLRITDIVPDILDWNKVPFCSIPEKKLESYLLNDGDIVIARTGATTGYSKYLLNVPKSIFASYLIRLRINKNINSRFIGYIVGSEDYKQFVKTNWGGAAQPNANAKILTSYPITLPPIAIQNKIVFILSAYDDLIKTNIRRIKILEEMAQNLYREWFVKFRFPGHQSTRFVDSPVGRIPEGWQISRISEIAKIYRGKSYGSNELADKGGLPFINLKCIKRDGGFRSSGIKRFTGQFKDVHKVRTGDIVMAITDMTQDRRIVARVGRIPRLDTDFGIFSMDLIRITNNTHLPENFLYSMFRWSDFAEEVKQYANGANVLHLLPDRILKYRFVCPSSDIAVRFDEIVTQFLLLCDSLVNKNQILSQARDLLLPKLISGELDVAELDIRIKEEIES